MLNLKDYILVVENAVTDTLSKTILEEYENAKEWEATVVGAANSYSVDLEVRSCHAIDMSNKSVIENNKTNRKTIDHCLYTTAASALLQYKKHYEKITNSEKHTAVQGDSGYTLLRYQEGDFYEEHIDHCLDLPRIISCSFVLNDDYEGGEFAFFGRELKYKLPKGSAIMFPSNFMYPHEIMPVTRGVRYSIITWFI